MPDRSIHIVIIGGGPVGLEAAAAGVAAGHRVTLLERGEIADHVRQWGHVRLFTTFAMNAGPAGRALLQAQGVALPSDDAMLSATEWRTAYLVPLAEALRPLVRLETGAAVRHVGRRHLLKNDAVGQADVRAADGFRILFDRHHGEHTADADAVLDCGGTWSNPNWLGPGGTPAVGERTVRSAICYHPPDVLFADFDRYAGRHTLLIGDGDSAATTAVALTQLADAVQGTRVTWVTRSSGSTPVAELPDDPLPGRLETVRRAGAVVQGEAPAVRWLPGRQVVAVHRDASGFVVELEGPNGVDTEQADEVVATIGYEPDDSLYRELQVHECYASRAPMKLAGALLSASGAGKTDCLDLGGFGPDVLVNPEPRFFILGAKSYGKTSAFLMRTGYEQVQDVMGLLCG